MVRLLNNIIFSHIPKTGGCWIRQALYDNDLILDNNSLLHTTLFVLPPAIEKPTVFTFVRHPISWYESWFRYQTQEGWTDWNCGKDYLHPCAPLLDCGSTNFNKYIEKCLKKVPGFVTSMYHMYTQFADYVGRQENLEGDFLRIMKMLKLDIISIDKLKRNVSPEMKIEWDKDLYQEVLSLEGGAIKQYGYARCSKRSYREAC